MTLRRLLAVSSEPIRPLKDVWLRPRRVFREMAAKPVDATDFILAAVQGVATSIAVYRAQWAGTHATVSEILGSSFLFGPLGGIASLYLFAAIYGRLGTRAGGSSARSQVFHVLAYGGIPVAASLLLWGITTLLVGDAALIDTPGVEVDGFVSLVLGCQFALYLLLLFWSVVLQVMGLSEVLNLTTQKAFGVWLTGQALALIAAIFLSVLMVILLPGLAPK